MLYKKIFTWGWHPTTIKINTPWKQLIRSVKYHNSCGPPTIHEMISAIQLTPITTTNLIQTRPKAALERKKYRKVVVRPWIVECRASNWDNFPVKNKSHSYLSDVLLTSSLFHRPQVSSRAVRANRARLIIKRIPIGP